MLSDMTAYYQKIRDAVSKGAYIVTEEDIILPSLQESLKGYKRLIAEHLEIEKTLKIINEGVEVMAKAKMYNELLNVSVPKEAILSLHDKTFERSIVTMPSHFIEVGNGTIQKGDLLKYKCGQIAEASLTIGCEVENYSPFFKVYRNINIMKNPPKTSEQIMEEIFKCLPPENPFRFKAAQLGYTTEEEIITALKQHSKMVEAMK